VQQQNAVLELQYQTQVCLALCQLLIFIRTLYWRNFFPWRRAQCALILLDGQVENAQKQVSNRLETHAFFQFL
jgi:hypothetical protein